MGGGVTPCILKLDTIWSWMVILSPGTHCIRGSVGPSIHGEKKNFCLYRESNSDGPFVPAVLCFTDWAICFEQLVRRKWTLLWAVTNGLCDSVSSLPQYWTYTSALCETFQLQVAHDVGSQASPAWVPFSCVFSTSHVCDRRRDALLLVCA
jgi:hypothetical protein